MQVAVERGGHSHVVGPAALLLIEPQLFCTDTLFQIGEPADADIDHYREESHEGTNQSDAQPTGARVPNEMQATQD